VCKFLVRNRLGSYRLCIVDQDHIHVEASHAPRTAPAFSETWLVECPLGLLAVVIGLFVLSRRKTAERFEAVAKIRARTTRIRQSTRRYRVMFLLINVRRPITSSRLKRTMEL
jgi:hypothetical protein